MELGSQSTQGPHWLALGRYHQLTFSQSPESHTTKVLGLHFPPGGTMNTTIQVSQSQDKSSLCSTIVKLRGLCSVGTEKTEFPFAGSSWKEVPFLKRSPSWQKHKQKPSQVKTPKGLPHPGKDQARSRAAAQWAQSRLSGQVQTSDFTKLWMGGLIYIWIKNLNMWTELSL